jgi:hypothetical protein
MKKKRKTRSKINRAVATQSDDSAEDEANESFSSPSILSQLGERFATQVTALLLSIAKDKLTEYLSNRKQKDENS